MAACVAQKNCHFHFAMDEKFQRFKDAKVEYRAEQVSARGACGSARGSRKGRGRGNGKGVSRRAGFDPATLSLIKMSHQWNAGGGARAPGAAGASNGRQCYRCQGFGHIRAHCPANNTPKP